MEIYFVFLKKKTREGCGDMTVREIAKAMRNADVIQTLGACMRVTQRFHDWLKKKESPSGRAAACVAVERNGRIQLIIDKSVKGYKAFAKVLNEIGKRGCFSWYGDVRDMAGIEQSGLNITARR